jgi:DnaJ-class molecular chaperone
VLGVDAHAPEDDIRRAFRRLAKDHHPDRFASAPPEELDRAKKRLAAITAAYHALTRAS